MTMITSRQTTVCTAGCLLAVLAGCRATKPSHYYVLDATAAGQASDATPRAVGLGPVRVAPYLDRPQIVTRPSANALSINEFHRWAEPVKDGVPRTIAANLVALSPGTRVVLYPWRSGDDVPIKVRVDVNRLDGVLDGDARLEADWTVDCGKDQHVFGHTDGALVQRVDGPDYEALARAESALLGALSALIDKDIRACAAR